MHKLVLVALVLVVIHGHRWQNRVRYVDGSLVRCKTLQNCTFRQQSPGKYQLAWLLFSMSPDLMRASRVTSVAQMRLSNTSELVGLRSRIVLNVGRERGTWMPKDWAASGARLFLPLNVTFSDERLGEEAKPEKLMGPSGGMRRLITHGEGFFIGRNGEQRVVANNGAWTAQPTDHPSGQILLRFYIDFPESANRNDVELPAGRVFFTTACWPRDTLAIASKMEEESVERISELRVEFDHRNEKDSFVGRFPNPFRRALNLRASVNLLKDIEYQQSSRDYLRDGLPDKEGIVEIPGETLSLAREGGLSVLRRGPLKRLSREEYHMLGRFTIRL